MIVTHLVKFFFGGASGAEAPIITTPRVSALSHYHPGQQSGGLYVSGGASGSVYSIGAKRGAIFHAGPQKSSFYQPGSQAGDVR